MSKPCEHIELRRAKTGGWFCVDGKCDFSIQEPTPLAALDAWIAKWSGYVDPTTIMLDELRKIACGFSEKVAPTDRSKSNEEMSAETLAALRGSIRKWERIVAGTGIDDGRDNCTLCQEFIDKTNSCSGCPVRIATGRSLCEGSPYEHYADTDEKAWFFRKTRLHYHAVRELEFLRSLVPLSAL